MVSGIVGRLEEARRHSPSIVGIGEGGALRSALGAPSPPIVAPITIGQRTKLAEKPLKNRTALMPSSAEAAVNTSAATSVNSDSKQSDPDAKFLAER